MQPNFADHLLQTLSWTFIHSLWLGLVLSVIAGVIMLFTAKSAASIRYALLTGSYFLFLSALIICFCIEWNSFDSEGAKLISSAANEDTGVFHQLWIQDVLNNFTGFLNANSYWIVSVWAIVILVKALKMLLDLLYVSRMRSRELYSPGTEWIQRVNMLAESVGIKKKVLLAESGMVKVPLVIGHLKPLILMPVGILSNLSVAEVEAVLLHELGHIRRHDYLVNFIQRITETLLFFNPGLLWVSSLIRIEREHCCDDIAIAKTDNRLQFAEALISFKEYSMKPQYYAMGLFGRKSLLLQRMTRIVYKRNRTLSPFEFLFFATNLVLFCLLVLGKGRQPDPVELNGTQSASYVESDSTVSTGDRNIMKASFSDEKKMEEGKAIFKRNPVRNTGAKREPVEEQPEPDDHTVMLDKQVVESMVAEQEVFLKNIQQHEAQKLQADRDREEAEVHRRIAEKDRLRAEQDRARAEIDRMNAAKDREQAEKDRQIAEKDRVQAEKDRQQANKDREIADVLRKKADEERRLSAAAALQRQ